MENRNGQIVDTETFEANGTAERDAGLAMLERVEGIGQITVGADKAYDTGGLRGGVPEHECDTAPGAEREAARRQRH